MTATAVARRLGGRKTLKRDIRTNVDLDEAVTQGLTYEALEHVLRSHDLEATEVYALIGSRRTLTRKSRARSRLSPAESDRLARVVRLIGRAEEALGDRDKVHRWLRKENRSLGGKRPLDLLSSDPGALQVEQILGRIEHGIVS
jgi:putative toxin-antitoxin system antitoxin component (TIGR02293 family)